MTHLEGVFVIKLLQEFISFVNNCSHFVLSFCKLFINTMMFQAANLTYNKEAGGAGLRKGDNNVKSWRGQRGSSAPSHPMQSLHSKHTNARAPSKQIVFDWEAWLGPKW